MHKLFISLIICIAFFYLEIGRLAFIGFQETCRLKVKRNRCLYVTCEMVFMVLWSAILLFGILMDSIFEDSEDE